VPLLLYKFVNNASFRYYLFFTIEEKFKFNKLTTCLFFQDCLIASVSDVISYGLATPLVLGIMMGFQSYLVIALFITVLVFVVLFQIIYPIFIRPRFHETVDLPDDDKRDKNNENLRDKIIKTLAKADLPYTSICLEKASNRTAHSNAYVSGIGPTRKIIIQDTLIDLLETEEIIAVVNHEIGHVVHSHLVWNSIEVLSIVLIFLIIFSSVYSNKAFL